MTETEILDEFDKAAALGELVRSGGYPYIKIVFEPSDTEDGSGNARITAQGIDAEAVPGILRELVDLL